MSAATLNTSHPVARSVKSAEHAESLEKLFSRIGQVSSLPSVANRILQVADDEASNATDLLEVVGQDPALAIRILRTVNSSYYGMTNEVGDLQTAISLLGFVEVNKLALTVYVARLCEEETSYRGFSREGLWNHMVAVGSIAREISKHFGLGNPDEAYMSGLLHDVGLLLIDQYMHEDLCKVIDLANDGMQTTDAEKKILTFDHTDLGAYIAIQCKLPDRIISAIRFHHCPSEFREEERALLDILTVANYLADYKNITSLGVQNVEPPSDEVCSALGLQADQITTVLDDLEDALDQAQVLAGI
jgi:putative nucleotidyltransferase with HDIG domain